jgi:hypothetical protein
MVGWIRRLALAGIASLLLFGAARPQPADAAPIISITGLLCDYRNQVLTIQNVGDQTQSLYHWFVTARVGPDRHEEVVYVFNYNDVLVPGGVIFLHSGLTSLLLPPRSQSGGVISVVIDYDIVWNDDFGDIATLYNAGGQLVAARSCDDVGTARAVGSWPAPPATGGIISGGTPPALATTFGDGAPAPPVPPTTAGHFGNPAAPAAIPPGGLSTVQVPPPDRFRVPGLTTIYDPSGRPQIQIPEAPVRPPPGLPPTGGGP